MSRTDDKIKEIERELFELKKVKRLVANAEIDKDRWGNERFYSVSVNDKADSVDFHHSCGCCPGAALYARPYLKVEGTKIYTDPRYFTIGYGNEFGFGEDEQDGWEEKMREKNISEEVIKKTREYLDDNKPGYDDEEDEDEDCYDKY